MRNNTLFTGDNLQILQGMRSESVDLIYVDPPFNSRRLYKGSVGSHAAGAAFKDMWSWADVDDWRIEGLMDSHAALVSLIMVVEQVHGEAMAAYLCYMSLRVIELRRVLRSTGSVYLHCDPTASHYLKGMMDVVFGKRQFRNEIVWGYAGGGTSKKDFPRKHDILFRYNKGSTATYHIQYRKYGVHNTTGKRATTRGGTRKAEYNPKGTSVNDWWVDIKPLINWGKEKIGYPTQKPLALLDRIIKSSSNEGDVVLDPFCGCATACVAAQNLGRRWIGIDISPLTARLVGERLADVHGKVFTDFVHRSDVPTDNAAKVMPININTKNKLVQEFGEKCNGCGLKVPKRNLAIDHVIPKAHGGGDYYENLQLLCGNCRRAKGDRPQEYLLAKIKKTQDALWERVTFGIRGKG